MYTVILSCWVYWLGVNMKFYNMTIHYRCDIFTFLSLNWFEIIYIWRVGDTEKMHILYMYSPLLKFEMKMSYDMLCGITCFFFQQKNFRFEFRIYTIHACTCHFWQNFNFFSTKWPCIFCFCLLFWQGDWIFLPMLLRCLHDLSGVPYIHHNINHNQYETLGSYYLSISLTFLRTFNNGRTIQTFAFTYRHSSSANSLTWFSWNGV